jgi:hypothetical protein
MVRIERKMERESRDGIFYADKIFINNKKKKTFFSPNLSQPR